MTYIPHILFAFAAAALMVTALFLPAPARVAAHPIRRGSRRARR